MMSQGVAIFGILIEMFARFAKYAGSHFLGVTWMINEVEATFVIVYDRNTCSSRKYLLV